MRRLSLHRSRLFWLGLPGLVFLLWAWWDSGGYVSYVRNRHGNAWQDLRVGRGWVEWKRVKEHSAVFSVADFVGVDRYELTVDRGSGEEVGWRGFDFPVFFLREELAQWMPLRRDSSSVRVALWVVVSGYVVVWLGAAWWWQRRKVRMMSGVTDAMREREVKGW